MMSGSREDALGKREGGDQQAKMTRGCVGGGGRKAMVESNIGDGGRKPVVTVVESDFRGRDEGLQLMTKTTVRPCWPK